MTANFLNEPVERIVWREADELRANDYNPNIVMTPELKLLRYNLLKHGWIQPILVNPNGIIIDGFHRWMLSRTDELVREKYAGRVPCVVMDVSDAEAMLLTIRMNRAKGSHVALRMSEIVRKLIDEHQYDPQTIATQIGAHLTEVDLLYQDGIFKARKLKDYKYSRAWVPGENTIDGGDRGRP